MTGIYLSLIQCDEKCVLQITVQETRGNVTNIRMSQLNLVDLAGSERQKDTMTAGVRLKVSVRLRSLFR
jgi:Kinesin motor domain